MLPERALAGVRNRPFGIYVHVPFCATRCGYCDFNTYTAGELGTSASPQSWMEGLRRELDAAAEMTGAPTVDTVFVGGGTPSLLGGDGLADVLGAIRSSFGVASGAEVTTESNPESTSPEFFDRLRTGGFTRISLGMQSAAQHVLKVLDRTHTPGRAVSAALEARAAGFEHVNLDLIYGTPGERDEDLDASLDAVLSAGVDHVSAYALIVEDGTALARKVRRGELPAPDDDVLASRYERIDARLAEAGLTWYEVSNWARSNGAGASEATGDWRGASEATGDWRGASEATGDWRGASEARGESRCRHNLGYWDGGNWWGAGPGAHSHVGGVRWWNVKHPARYAEQLAAGRLPVGGSEQLTVEDLHVERVMLTARLRTGLPVAELDAGEQRAAEEVAADGLLVREHDHFVLTGRGRLLADAVIRTVLR
ncbi:coproporphyrinogen-III oxidase family protein [Rhodococcus marinonascens]|uniref:coproporphyrinogen-III oxidase family protein n=1 Tax=Rhodococcus marinonascens TaxID=38311 RepID=UPI000AB93E76|nr:coproporphyrinogen-III oxidase family protein [Rhodococcus marinonascens]